jgi:hypothetical protein
MCDAQMVLRGPDRQSGAPTQPVCARHDALSTPAAAAVEFGEQFEEPGGQRRHLTGVSDETGSDLVGGQVVHGYAIEDAGRLACW